MISTTPTNGSRTPDDGRPIYVKRPTTQSASRTVSGSESCKISAVAARPALCCARRVATRSVSFPSPGASHGLLPWLNIDNL
jgi:hypothetical protein